MQYGISERVLNKRQLSQYEIYTKCKHFIGLMVEQQKKREPSSVRALAKEILYNCISLLYFKNCILIDLVIGI